MTRYIVLDMNSGFIWGEAQAENHIAACRQVDEETRNVVDFAGVTYDETSLHGNPTYVAYEAPSDYPAVTDGQDQQQIDAACKLPLAGFVSRSFEGE